MTQRFEVESVIVMMNRSFRKEDLNTLQEWAHTWQIKFNIQKCKVMRVGDSDSGLKRVSEYSMGNQKLEYCDTERDLGVIMSTD